MTIWLAIVTLVLGTAVLGVMLWKVPDPNHKFMLNLYSGVLGPEPEQLDAGSVEPAELADRLRRVVRAG